MDCGLRWDLSYGGQTLNGVTLKGRIPHYYLRRGRAWGQGVQAWHTTGDANLALNVMLTALEQDADEQKRNGVYLPDEHAEMYELLSACMLHYTATMPRLALAEPEKRLLVKIPHLRGWRLDARLDGVATVDGELYPYESKLRNTLSSLEQITLSRQPRWYAAAWRTATGKTPAGFIVDERLAKAPEPDSPVRFNKDGSISKVQSCTPEAYNDACYHRGQPVDDEVLDRAAKRHDPRTYHARHTVRFTEKEMDEAEAQMVSAAHLIRMHERGILTPIRNPSRQRCPSCTFREICASPTLEEAHAFFDFQPPKRARTT